MFLQATLKNMEQTEEVLMANLVLPIVKDLVLPIIEKSIKDNNKDQINPDLLISDFSIYLCKRYLKYSHIDTITFPNKQTLFEQLYEPLTLTTNIKRDEQIVVKIDKFPEEIFSNYYRFIIEDTAGMGKSTILMKLFRTAIEEKKGIPILIPLRQINKENDFITEIQNQLSVSGNTLKVNTIFDLLKQGTFIFLLDGFDEISNSDRDFVFNDLHRFIENATDNYFAISSRPENSIAAFGDFQKFHVKPLSDEEAFSLIKRYDYYSFKPISNDLIKQLDDNTNDSLKDYLKNPFLVSLLYKSFDYRKDIPLKRSQFYRQVFDALFEAHDLSKEGYLRRDKYSKLHSDDFDRVLRHVAYLTSIENKIEYDKDYILNIINKAKKYVSDLSFKASDFLKDLLETVPLFRKDGIYIKWAHKSLQDYFAAKFIWVDSKENQPKILKKIYDDPHNIRFFVLLDIFYELDTSTFENTILLWFLQDFEKHASVCAEVADIPFNQIKRRAERSFTHDFSVVFLTKDIFNEKYPDLIDSAFPPRTFNKDFNASEESICFLKRIPNSNIVSVCFLTLDYRVYDLFKLIKNRHPSFANPSDMLLNIVTGDISIPFNEVIHLEYTEGNPLNSISMFDITTTLLSVAFSINYDYAIQLLNKINHNKHNSLSDDLTNW